MDMWREEENEKLRGIYGVLSRLGLSANYTGFFQLAWAVWRAKEEPERLQMVTKRLYPEVAKRCNTSWQAVERNLRTAVGVIWKWDTPYLRQIVGSPLPAKPRNAWFLSLLAACAPEDGVA